MAILWSTRRIARILLLALALSTIRGSTTPGSQSVANLAVEQRDDDLANATVLFIQRRAGPEGSGAQSSAQGAAQGVAPTTPQDILEHYDRLGRQIYVPLVLGSVEEADRLISRIRGVSDPFGSNWQRSPPASGEWHQLQRGGWTEYDLSPQLLQDGFMQRCKPLFKRMNVGNRNLGNLDAHAPWKGVSEANDPPRQPSALISPDGPNRMLRLQQDQVWSYEVTARAKGHCEATNAVVDLIINMRDNYLILLPSPSRKDWMSEAWRKDNPPFSVQILSRSQRYASFPDAPLIAQAHILPSTQGPVNLAPLQTRPNSANDPTPKQCPTYAIPEVWTNSHVLHAQWVRQHMTETLRQQHANFMEPRMTLPYLSSPEKLKLIEFVIIPELDGEPEVEIVKACLDSAELNNLPAYGQPRSFFPAGSWCFNALLAAPASNTVAWWLGQRKGDGPFLFGKKVISGVSITVLEPKPGQTAEQQAKPTLLWHVDDPTQKDAECVEHWGKFSLRARLPLVPGSSASQSQAGKGKGSVLPGKGDDGGQSSQSHLPPENLGGDKTASVEPPPEKCYAGMMKSWRDNSWERLFGPASETTAGQAQRVQSGVAPDDPMDIDQSPSQGMGAGGSQTQQRQGGPGAQAQPAGQGGQIAGQSASSGQDQNTGQALSGAQGQRRPGYFRPWESPPGKS